MDDPSKFAYFALGFKESGGPGYPCHWCGTPTTSLDAENFSVCEECQIEYATIGHEEMKRKYPLAGTDERNPSFFTEQAARHLARGKLLKESDLRLLMQRGCAYEQEYAQAILNGTTLGDAEMEWLGRSAEQYIDEW